MDEPLSIEIVRFIDPPKGSVTSVGNPCKTSRTISLRDAKLRVQTLLPPSKLGGEVEPNAFAGSYQLLPPFGQVRTEVVASNRVQPDSDGAAMFLSPALSDGGRGDTVSGATALLFDPPQPENAASNKPMVAILFTSNSCIVIRTLRPRDRRRCRWLVTRLLHQDWWLPSEPIHLPKQNWLYLCDY